MTDTAPVLMWFRRDLRLGDNAALRAAVDLGRPVIPVFIHDEVVEAHGAAPKWRLGLGVAALADRLSGMGSRLILRRGRAEDVLTALIRETGAGAVYWSRLYDPDAIARDKGVKAALGAMGVEAKSFAGHVLFEPWTVETKTGDYYKVYSPFWRAVKDRVVPVPAPAPSTIKSPEVWPASDTLSDWAMGAAMRRGADVVAPYLAVGEAAARDRLDRFIDERADTYKARRDYPAQEATSRLSENLTYGEISPATIWHAGMRAHHEGAAGAEHFLKELVWRDFAYHLAYHTPRIVSDNWREGWDSFPWSEDGDTPEVTAWKQGRTGIRFVDAAMREMYVTGTMHNRARMIVGSYLTKHLMTHWRVGLKWFEDCLVDWDPAANAMGWQWVAGCGPDAAPYFRIFNPETQLDKFDGDGAYTARWIAEGATRPSATALSYFDAIPESWPIGPSDRYPTPSQSLEAGRRRALTAYEKRDF